jgi:hypothetical protein
MDRIQPHRGGSSHSSRASQCSLTGPRGACTTFLMCVSMHHHVESRDGGPWDGKGVLVGSGFRSERDRIRIRRHVPSCKGMHMMPGGSSHKVSEEGVDDAQRPPPRIEPWLRHLSTQSGFTLSTKSYNSTILPVIELFLNDTNDPSPPPPQRAPMTKEGVLCSQTTRNIPDPAFQPSQKAGSSVYLLSPLTEENDHFVG